MFSPCVGCAQSNPVASAGAAVAPSNPYAAGPAATGGSASTGAATATASKPCCGGCASKGDDTLWRDILTALIVTLVVGGLFFGRSQ